MSRAKPISERVEREAYFTPPWCVHRLLEALPYGLSGNWLEPACGSGNIVRSAMLHPAGSKATWFASDIEPAERALHLEPDTLSIQDIGNGLRGQRWPESFDGMMTNPPFSMAADFLSVGLKVAKTVILLLRMNWLSSSSRGSILDGNMPDVYILPNRPSFVNDKTDSTEYAWMVWESGKPRRRGLIERLAVTSKEERNAR